MENFVDFQVYEDAAPLSTLETSFQIILLEYTDILLQREASSLNIPIESGKTASHKDLTDTQINTLHQQDMMHIQLSIDNYESRDNSKVKYSFQYHERGGGESRGSSTA